MLPTNQQLSAVCLELVIKTINMLIIPTQKVSPKFGRDLEG